MFFDETTFILNLMEISNTSLSSHASGAMTLLFMGCVVLFCLSLVILYLLTMYVIHAIPKYLNLTKGAKICLFSSIAGMIISVCSATFAGYFMFYIGASDSESILRYAKFRYIKYVKDNQDVKPEIKELIERYLVEGERRIKVREDYLFRERFRKLLDNEKE